MSVAKPVTKPVTKPVAGEPAKVCLKFVARWQGSNTYLGTVMLTERKRMNQSKTDAWARALQYKVAKCMGIICRKDALCVRVHLKTCSTSITLPLRQSKDTKVCNRQYLAFKNAWSLLLAPQATTSTSSSSSSELVTVPVTVSRYSAHRVALCRILTSSRTAKTCVYATLPLELRRNRCIAMHAVAAHVDSLAHVPDSFSDSDMLLLHLNAVRHFPLALKHATQNLKANRSVCEEAVNLNPEALQHVGAVIRDDFDFVLKAVHKNCCVLRHASYNLRATPELAHVAVEKKGAMILVTTNGLYFDKALTLKAVRQNGMCLRIVDRHFRNDFEVVGAAINECAYALKYASLGLMFDETLVRTAVESNGFCLSLVCNVYGNDATIVEKAVRNFGLALAYASPALRNNSRIVLLAVQNNGLALQYASPALKCDLCIVRAAVENNSLALQYATPILQNDETIVLFAVHKYGLALEYASPTQQDNPRTVKAAIKNNGCALQYASPALQNDELMLEAAETAPHYNKCAGCKLNTLRHYEIMGFARSCWPPFDLCSHSNTCPMLPSQRRVVE